MPAEAQSAQDRTVKAQPDSALKDKEFLRSTLSPEEYERWRRQQIAALKQLGEKMGKYAEAQGMTDEVFARLLAED